MKISLEAVDYQHDILFYNALTKSIGNVRTKSKDVTTTSDGMKDLVTLINKFTGMDISVQITNNTAINAMVEIPSLTKSHPLVNDNLLSGISDRTSLRKLVDKGMPSISGTVDRRKGKVGGVFSEIQIDMFITSGAIMSPHITDEEIAALALHEIGHVFSYFEALVYTVRQNIYLAAVVEEFTNSNVESYRVDLVDKLNKELDLNEDPDSLKHYDDSRALYTVLLTKYTTKLRSRLGVNYYDNRSFEAAADQYAANMGAGRELSSILSKTGSLQKSKRTTSSYLIIEITKMLSMGVLVTLLGPFFALSALLTIDPTVDTYDPPEARIRRIRHNLVNATKDRSISRDKKKSLLEDIKYIDKLLAELTDRRTFYEILYTELLPNLRNQTRRLEAEQALERLASNDLYKNVAALDVLK